jgi:DNA-binding CsgD family transcriptional regulator
MAGNYKKVFELTPREREIAEMLNRGMTVAEIAKATGLGVPVIAKHKINIIEKERANKDSGIS